MAVIDIMKMSPNPSHPPFELIQSYQELIKLDSDPRNSPVTVRAVNNPKGIKFLLSLESDIWPNNSSKPLVK
ncbi:hypothetical protein ACOSQ2_023153 [Xanthoceras sorbifolium]